MTGLPGSFWERVKRLGLDVFLFKGPLYEEDVAGDKTVRKQVIKAKGDVKVSQPVVNILALNASPEVLEHLLELYGADAGLVREDLLLPEHAIVSPRQDRRQLIREFRGYIPDEDYQALIAAEALCQMEDSGRREAANKFRRNLHRRFGERGAHIYNRYRSGYLEDFFLPKLRWVEYECQERKRDVARLFGKFWNDQLEFFEHAVWTNEMMTPSQIVEELTGRLKRRGVRRVYVYARGPANVDKARAAVEDWLSQLEAPRYRKLEEKYPIAKTPCICITIEHTK